MSSEALDMIVLTEYPYPIAVSYRRILDAQGWPAKVEEAILAFEFGLRMFALFMISQYLIRDTEQVNDPTLNKILFNKLPKATLGSWKEIFFISLKAYEGKRDLFFLKELYDLYWDTSQTPHRARFGIQRPYDRLISIRNELVHRVEPSTENGWQILGEDIIANLREFLEQFSFFNRYDLVRIIEHHENEYTFLKYTGEYPDTSRKIIESTQDLDLGFHLLLKSNNELLKLHPLLIYWEDPLITQQQATSGDVALYDGLTRTSTTYIAPVSHRRIEVPSVADESRRPPYNVVNKEQKHRPDALVDIQKQQQNVGWDVFISHAWEDKEALARPLAKALEAAGLRVWYDEFTLKIGDKLGRSIDRGLANSRYGIVILSPNFFAKEWPQKELSGLVTREVDGSVVILPVWHNLSAEDVRRYSPSLADRVAANSDRGINQVVHELLRVLRSI